MPTATSIRAIRASRVGRSTSYDASGNVVATTTSDANGNYEFDNLFPGSFMVSEVLMPGWTQTQPVNPDYYAFATQSGLNETGLNFGNYLAGHLHRQRLQRPQWRWHSGTRRPASGELDRRSSRFVRRPRHLHDQQCLGRLRVRQPVARRLHHRGDHSAGWDITQPTNPPGTYTLAASSGEDLTGLDFGNFKTTTINGSVYNDLDGNGLRGSGEPGLAGWTVDLEDSSGNVLATVLTDSNGNYSFTGVGAGTYIVAEVVQTNWVQTQPLYPTVYTLTTQSGLNLNALNFGDHASPALSPVAVIDNGQPGYSETGTFSTVLGGFNGTNRVARTLQASGQPATASWYFQGLTPGSYSIYVTYAGKSTYSKAAPFGLYNGATKLATVNINESILVTQSQGGSLRGATAGSAGSIWGRSRSPAASFMCC